ncbi:unnamed protein product [Sympodiomycopsis kandeliae]
MAQANNIWAPVGSPGNTYEYNSASYSNQGPPQDMYGPPSPTPSNSSRNRFTSWFSRSRSGSPANGNSRSRSRSRSKSPNLQNGSPAIPGTFVVRNVVKQSGGVSWDPSHDDPSQHHASNLSYRPSKSRPLAAGGPTSLGVPPGGPGGGTGYGTAFSSNDGRPEPREALPPMPSARPMSGSEHRRAENLQLQQQQQQFQPPARPVSPGYTKAAAFQRPRSIRSTSPGPGPAKPRTPNSQQERQKQHRFSVSPGPASWKQQQEEDENLHHPPQPPFSQHSPDRSGRPLHTFPASIAGQPQYGQGHTQQQQQQQQQQLSYSPQQSSPLSHGLASTAADRIPGFDPSQFRTADSQGSLGPTPSPADLQGKKRQSIDARAAGFGFMGGHETANGEGGHSNKRASAAGNSPGLASRIRGFFNTPTRGDGEGQGQDSSDEDDLRIGTPYGVSASAYQKATGSSPRKPPDAEDREAEVRRQRSHREAVRLIDEERRAAIEGSSQSPDTSVPTLPSGIARELAAEGWTSEALQRMTEDGRQNLVRRLTANGKVSREASQKMQQGTAHQPEEQEVELDWNTLTPAQRIIAETRSRQIQRDRIDEQAKQQEAKLAQQKVAQEADISMEVPVRRATRSPKKDQSAARFPNRPTEPKTSLPDHPQPQSQPNPRSSPQVSSPPAGQPQQTKAGLSPGTGPMPSELGLMGGLQEMMTRFYRYERYSVPLLRALEMRLIDIERDAQMAHASADNASDRTGRTDREKEMDKWVGQMTNLMRHEIGQLKAATKEIREGREMLGAIAKHQTGGGGGSRFASARQDTGDSNVARQLTLPPGAAPALDKDQGKAAHGQPASAAGVDPALRARSTSPNGRPKYTNALGMPLTDGRRSPERAATPVNANTSLHSTVAAGMPASQESFSIEAQDETEDGDGHDDSRDAVVTSVSQPDSRTQVVSPTAIAARPAQSTSTASKPPSRYDAISPPLSDGGSTTSAGGRRRAISVNERLKSLMSNPPSRTGTPATNAVPLDDEEDVKAAGESESRIIRSSSPQSMARPEQSEKSTAGFSNPTPVRTTAAPVHAHLRDGSNKSAASSITVMPNRSNTGLAPPAATPTRKNTSPLGSPSSPTVGLIGGRTSPSPSSFAGNNSAQANVSPSGSGFTRGRQGSTSPGVPNVKGENIKTSTNASSGLRARAQSYLLSADNGSSLPSSPTPASSSRPGLTASLSGSNKEDIAPTRGSAFSTRSNPTAQTSTKDTPPLSISKAKSSHFAGNNNSSSPQSTLLSRERTKSSPANNNNAIGTNKSSSNKSVGGMTLKERVAFFEVSANK